MEELAAEQGATRRRRHTKTEQRIREALARLLSKKGLDALTVSDVAREAGINRGTFYAHYTDKYDLMEKQIQSVIDEIRDLLLAPGQKPADAHDLIPRANIIAALSYVRDNREFVAAVTSNGTDARLQSQVKDALAQLIECRARSYPELTLSYHGIPTDYGREMLLSGVTSVIWLWLRKGCVEPPEEICDIVLANKDLAPVQLLD